MEEKFDISKPGSSKLFDSSEISELVAQGQIPSKHCILWWVRLEGVLDKCDRF